MNNYSKKTVLITGATGLIGNNLVDAFMKMGDVSVIALSRNIEKLEVEFAEYKSKSNFKMIAQDISEPLNIIDTVDYIFHAAGSMEGKVIKNSPVDIIKPNLIGTMNCLDFLRNQKERSGNVGRMILFSSVSVYGNNTMHDISVSESETSISQPLDCINAPYVQSKRMLEVIATSYAKQYGLNVVIARFSTVYGPTRIAPDTAFFEFIKNSIKGENILINSSGLPKRDNLYIDDAISGVLLIGAKGKDGEVYNVSSNGDLGNFVSVEEIAHIVSRQSNNAIVVQHSDSHNSEIRRPGIRLDNSKIKSLGWNVTVGAEEGIKKTIRIMKKIYMCGDN